MSSIEASALTPKSLYNLLSAGLPGQGAEADGAGKGDGPAQELSNVYFGLSLLCPAGPALLIPEEDCFGLALLCFENLASDFPNRDLGPARPCPEAPPKLKGFSVPPLEFLGWVEVSGSFTNGVDFG